MNRHNQQEQDAVLMQAWLRSALDDLLGVRTQDLASNRT